VSKFLFINICVVGKIPPNLILAYRLERDELYSPGEPHAQNLTREKNDIIKTKTK
jgi:hypothetical protein